MPQPYLVLDADLTIVGASDRYLALTERTLADIVGQHILEAFPENPEEIGTVEQGPLEVSLRHVLATRKPHEMAVIQYDIPRPGGGFEQKFWTPVHSPVLGPDGDVAYIIQNPMDVTQSVIKEREADARLRVALHAADLGSWEYEPETDMWRRSHSVDELFGFEPGKGGSVAAPFFARMHTDDLPGIMKSVEEALACPDQTVLHFNYRIARPDGTIRHVASRGEILRTSSGKVRMIGVMMDTTADRNREAELAFSVQAQTELLGQKDALLAEINHRVKNSLQLVVSVLSLQARKLTDPTTKEALDRAVSRVRAITSVHERLYRTNDPLTIDMADYLKGLCADLSQNTAAGVEIEVDVQSIKLKTERAIPIAIIVNELVTNAQKYAATSDLLHPIVVSMKDDGSGTIDLAVHDRGSGPIADATQGLGTRLVKTMAQQIGGRFESTTGPSGYRASVHFPGDAR